MHYSKFALAFIAMAAFASSSVLAADEAIASTHDGKVVSVTGDQLIMTNKDGKEHSHTMALEAKVTCDGTACKASDLKAGMKIRVTTKTGDKSVATNVEAINKNTLFANTHDGKFVSFADNKLTMSDSNGKEHSHMVAKGALMTCDCKNCSSDHLKAGMKIRVTTKAGAAGDVTNVEAIDKDPKFAEII